MEIGQRIKKQPLNVRDKGSDRTIKIGIVAHITKHCLTIEYEDNTKESFTIADIISPQTFILKARKGKEWNQIIAPRRAMTMEFLRGD